VAQQPLLRPGLYLLRVSNLQPGLVYIIFWPEEATWDDNAPGVVSRNRTTFMRYMFYIIRNDYLTHTPCRFLSKLCDQVVVLISDQHSEKLVFKNDTERVHVGVGEFDAGDHSRRYFHFEVQQTSQQEESATAGEGFKVIPMHHLKTVSNGF